jgi:hypothetical protein
MPALQPFEDPVLQVMSLTESRDVWRGNFEHLRVNEVVRGLDQKRPHIPPPGTKISQRRRFATPPPFLQLSLTQNNREDPGLWRENR